MRFLIELLSIRDAVFTGIHVKEGVSTIITSQPDGVEKVRTCVSEEAVTRIAGPHDIRHHRTLKSNKEDSKIE